MVYPMYQSGMFLGNPSLADVCLGLLFYLFIDNVAAWTLFDSFVAETQYQLIAYLPSVTNPVFDATGITSAGIYTFESCFTGSIEQTGTPSYEFKFKLQNKFDYQYSNGVLKGMHYKSHGTGTYNGEKSSFTCEFLVEEYGMI
ncbi:MAG: choice-of-anchor S family protein [Candidatus Thorarchaeota archaeon]